MDVENNWAAPTIGSIQVPDRDLGRRLGRQPNVEMRAKMLGLDWTTLTAARARLLLGAWLITPAISLLALSGLGRLSITALVLVPLAAVLPMIALRSVSRLPILIARNDASTATRYVALAKLSPSRSLLGYRVRWMLVRHAALTVAAIALASVAVRGF